MGSNHVGKNRVSPKQRAIAGSGNIDMGNEGNGRWLAQDVFPNGVPRRLFYKSSHVYNYISSQKVRGPSHRTYCASREALRFVYYRAWH